MGMLDDAIREHMELKRLKGADPTAVAREEHDALGPVGRATEPVGASGGDAESHSAPLEECAEPGRAEEAPEAEPVGQETLEINMEAELHGDGIEEAPEQSAGTQVAPVGHPAHMGADAQDSLEWEMPGDRDVDDAFDRNEAPSSGEPESEDVLEETPDFLRETPEHERLWFEQRPPRDFDFNE